GLPIYIQDGANISAEISNGFECPTCHNDLETFSIYEVAEVEFPSGAVLDTGDPNSNLCINCHQGRESTVSVNAALEGKEEDTVSSSIRFKNSHYYPAGATLFGTEAKGAYEYAGNSYKGRFEHQGTLNRCTNCHDSHSLDLKITCGGWCHEGNDPKKYREGTNDWDGDGNLAEGLGGEVDSLHHILWDTIQDYAANIAGMPIQYSAGYPYYFKDVNGNGEVDDEDGSYKSFTPRLLRAVYNYQFVKKDPGAFAHNGRYIVQILQDSIVDLGEKVTVDTDDMIRPDATGQFDNCGDATHPYPIGDINKDCVVDLFDFAMMSGHWLDDNNPN
ncbi:MAG: hypothetical protein KAS23_04220, partial [Anaerohalosphaera sp.]|nr:hypothetical protein [Anaerohalosphaera sp.]